MSHNPKQVLLLLPFLNTALSPPLPHPIVLPQTLKVILPNLDFLKCHWTSIWTLWIMWHFQFWFMPPQWHFILCTVELGWDEIYTFHEFSKILTGFYNGIIKNITVFNMRCTLIWDPWYSSKAVPWTDYANHQSMWWQNVLLLPIFWLNLLNK